MDAPVFEKRKTKLPIFTFSELLRATFRLYGQNFSRFIFPVALVTVPSIMLTAAVSEWITRTSGLTTLSSANAARLTPEQMSQVLGESISAIGALSVVLFVISFIQNVVIVSIITWLTSESYLGRGATLGESARAVFSRFWSLVGGLIGYNIILILLFIALSVVLFLCGLGIGLIAFVNIALGSLIVPIFILERTGIGLGLRRGWYLAKRRFWLLFGVAALTTVAAYTGGLVVAAISGSGLTLSVIFQSLLSIALVPFVPIANTLIYYDARVRYEDLEGALNATDKADARPADVDSPAYAGPLLDGSDFTNLGIMTALLFVIILVIGGVSIATSAAGGFGAPLR